MFLAGFDGRLRRERALHLADMGFAKEKHTDTGLADTAAYGVGELFFDDRMLEGELLSFRAAGLVELA